MVNMLLKRKVTNTVCYQLITTMIYVHSVRIQIKY